MTRTGYRKIGVVAGTLLIAFVEWLLFELIRTPYRPPHDMRTLLGQEKYGVVGFMGVLFTISVATMLCLALSSRFTLRDYLAFTALLGVLLAVGRYLSCRKSALARHSLGLGLGMTAEEAVNDRLAAWVPR